MSYEIDMTGQVAIVTGGGRGIGAATAGVLAQAGAQVVVADLAGAGMATEVPDRTGRDSLQPLCLQEDVSSEDGARRVVERAVKEFGRVDVLVNNAGVVADWDRSWAVHVKASFYCSEAAKKVMAQNAYGRIVLISSTAAFTGSTGIPEYVSSKGGAVALTRYLARQYAPLGILVNAIAPAVIKSDMLMARYHDEQEMLRHYIPQMPIGRIGYPIDIARVVLFLCSELSSYVCGQIIVADGGRMHLA
ncbi:MAG: SDR family NAD(P)-dependent oxidoreductase [Ignavibacteriales bacterium]